MLLEVGKKVKRVKRVMVDVIALVKNAGMILGAKFCSWANFPWFFQKRDSLF
jgi:hypothetical protein